MAGSSQEDIRMARMAEMGKDAAALKNKIIARAKALYGVDAESAVANMDLNAKAKLIEDAKNGVGAVAKMTPQEEVQYAADILRSIRGGPAPVAEVVKPTGIDALKSILAKAKGNIFGYSLKQGVADVAPAVDELATAGRAVMAKPNVSDMIAKLLSLKDITPRQQMVLDALQNGDSLLNAMHSGVKRLPDGSLIEDVKAATSVAPRAASIVGNGGGGLQMLKNAIMNLTSGGQVQAVKNAIETNPELGAIVPAAGAGLSVIPGMGMALPVAALGAGTMTGVALGNLANMTQDAFRKRLAEKAMDDVTAGGIPLVQNARNFFRNNQDAMDRMRGSLPESEILQGLQQEADVAGHSGGISLDPGGLDRMKAALANEGSSPSGVSTLKAVLSGVKPSPQEQAGFNAGRMMGDSPNTEVPQWAFNIPITAAANENGMGDFGVFVREAAKKVGPGYDLRTMGGWATLSQETKGKILTMAKALSEAPVAEGENNSTPDANMNGLDALRKAVSDVGGDSKAFYKIAQQ